MCPDILVTSTFTALFILFGDYKAVRSLMSKIVKKSIFELKMILLPANWKISTVYLHAFSILAVSWNNLVTRKNKSVHGKWMSSLWCHLSLHLFLFFWSQATFSSMIRNWLNHEWMQTWNVDVKPFHEKTHSIPTGEFILKSNYSLISMNC